MDNIRIAQIRAVPAKGDLAGNQERLMTALRHLAATSVDVVVTPECFLDGYVATEEWVDSASIRDYAIDPAESRYVDGLQEWARERSAWIVFGCCRVSAGRVYNSALVIGREGEIVGVYDKTHCQTHDVKFQPGGSIPVFQSDFGPFGVLICADRRWPETVRSLALRGARIVFNPTYGMHNEKNLHLMQTRSYESEVFIAFTHPRQSLLTDPSGEIACNDTHDDADCSVTVVDLSEVDRVRAGPSAHLRDRRPELYS